MKQEIIRYHTDQCVVRPKDENATVITIDGSDLSGVIAYKTNTGNLVVYQEYKTRGGFVSLNDLIEGNYKLRFMVDGPGSWKHEALRKAIRAGKKVYGFFDAVHLRKNLDKIERS